MSAHDLDLQAISESFLRGYELAPQDAAAIEEMLALFEVRSLQDGEVLFREHNAGDDAFLLIRGRVSVSKCDVRGDSTSVSTLEAPSLFGHMSLIDGSPRSATCAAVGACVVSVIEQSAFTSLVRAPGARGAALRRLLIAAMSEQLAGANGRIRTIIDPPPDFPVDDETTEHGIEEANQALEGWKGRSAR
ncbi:MAG: cyclic nucleotide-binding domain-containing protein [Pseudomonadota bacterium]|nr:cyclic nucleotide-binding domain-containing protein [Pseudomonadota bacterium]